MGLYKKIFQKHHTLYFQALRGNFIGYAILVKISGKQLQLVATMGPAVHYVQNLKIDTED